MIESRIVIDVKNDFLDFARAMKMPKKPRPNQIRSGALRASETRDRGAFDALRVAGPSSFSVIDIVLPHPEVSQPSITFNEKPGQ